MRGGNQRALRGRSRGAEHAPRAACVCVVVVNVRVRVVQQVLRQCSQRVGVLDAHGFDELQVVRHEVRVAAPVKVSNNVCGEDEDEWFRREREFFLVVTALAVIGVDGVDR